MDSNSSMTFAEVLEMVQRVDAILEEEKTKSEELSRVERKRKNREMLEQLEVEVMQIPKFINLAQKK